MQCKGQISEKGETKMLKEMKGLKVGLMAGLITSMATPAFARGIDLREAGIALWVFAAIGAIIILLQLIPAAILFFSFIGTTTTVVFKKGQRVEEEVILPAVEPIPVEK
jgi:hypothetical protein